MAWVEASYGMGHRIAMLSEAMSVILFLGTIQKLLTKGRWHAFQKRAIKLV
jgi:hypothetical protein